MLAIALLGAYYTQQSPSWLPLRIQTKENIMTMLDTIREAQTRSIEQMRTAQEQIIEFNERIADTVTGALPDFQSPFAAYLPKSTDLISTYFEFLNNLNQANAEFASRMVKAWDRDLATAAS